MRRAPKKQEEYFRTLIELMGGSVFSVRVGAGV